MNYYELRDCSGILPNVWTDADLSDMNLNQLLQTVEYPGLCWEIVQIVDLDPQVDPIPVLTVITPVGPVFNTCVECLSNIVQGCTDPRACNFNPCATIDDGSCFYNNVTIRILCDGPLTNCGINSNEI